MSKVEIKGLNFASEVLKFERTCLSLAMPPWVHYSIHPFTLSKAFYFVFGSQLAHLQMGILNANLRGWFWGLREKYT